jgi:hypothetical protein
MLACQEWFSPVFAAFLTKKFDTPAAIWKLRCGVFDARSGGAWEGTPVFMEGQACGAI